MKQAFTKTIQGHQLEFKKQFSKEGYNVSQKDAEFKGILSLQKDKKGIWNVIEADFLPPWYNEISTYVHNAIEENEMTEVKASDFTYFSNPF